jgi:DNA-binding response OmpR family regulator
MIGVKTILLVENDLVALTMYSDRLAREGFHVSTAEDGETALRYLETASADLVVLDLMLPRLSGAEVFKKMRSDQRLCNVPVIIFSNATLPEWPENIAVGPTKCLLKSDTTFAMLLETLHESLNAAAMASSAIQTANGSMPVNNGQTPANTAQTAAPEAPPVSTAQSTERADFLKEAVAELPKIREDCFGYIKAPTSTASSQHLATLTDRIEVLRTRAGRLGCGRVSLLATPFHTLLAELAAKPAKATPSILQTIAQAVDCLGLVLRSSSDETENETLMAPQALVVDDDPVSNQVNVTALQQASFETTSIDDPLTALEILAATEFDLIVLDINMPNLTGFEVCEKLRRLPQAKTTPVIFLTAFNNFENRKQSVLSGGGDFISKPVSVRELALKATIHLLKAQVKNARKANPETPGSAAAPQAAPKTERTFTQPISSNTLVSATESATTAPETSTVAAPAAPQLEPVLAGAPVGTAPVNSGASPQYAPAFAGQSAAPQSAPAANQRDHAALLERTAFVESELKTVRTQLETATAATLQAQTAREERATRCKQLEDEIASLRRNHDELETQFNINRDAALRSEQKIVELQTQLQHATNELQSTRSGASSDAADRARVESELREQIIAANLAADKTSAALKEKEEWCVVLEKEIAPLRKLGETLTQQSTVMGVELEKARTETQREVAERTRIESDLRSQLTAAAKQSEQANARAKEQEERAHALQQEIATLRPAHDQVQQKHAATTDELERIKAELEKINSDRARSESDLQQKLTASNQQAEQANARAKEHEDRVNALQQEIAALRPAHDQVQQKHAATTGELERIKAELEKINSDRARSESDLQQKLTASNQQAEQANARAKEHEQRVHTLEQELATLRPAHDQAQQKHEATSGEIERLKGELEKTAAERTKSESELRDQLNTTKTNLETTATALKQKEEWCQLLEEEMAPLRDIGEQLRQERQQKTDLERAKGELEKKAAELEQKVAEHAHIETDLRNQANNAKASLEKAEKTLREKEEWFRTLEEELAPLRQVRHQFQQQVQQHQQTEDELARLKADLEKHNAERARLEAECKNLAAGKEGSAQELARAHAELEKERNQRQHLEKRSADIQGRLQSFRNQFNDLFPAE